MRYDKKKNTILLHFFVVSSWCLWGNSTHLDELRRVEIPKRVDVLLNTVIEFNGRVEKTDPHSGDYPTNYVYYADYPHRLP